MHFDLVVTRVVERLSGPLPGPAAQALLAPWPRREWPSGLSSDNARHAAGLLLLYPIAARAHVLLTRRADTLGRHGGQISLPGGVVDPGETFEQAALREANEEVALPIAEARVIGRLTPIDIPVSGFRLHPVIAVAGSRPAFRPAAGEVAGILEIAVEALCARGSVSSSQRERDGARLTVPAFHVGGDEIWGATAMVLAEFLSLLGWPETI